MTPSSHSVVPAMPSSSQPRHGPRAPTRSTMAARRLQRATTSTKAATPSGQREGRLSALAIPPPSLVSPQSRPSMRPNCELGSGGFDWSAVVGVLVSNCQGAPGLVGEAAPTSRSTHIWMPDAALGAPARPWQLPVPERLIVEELQVVQFLEAVGDRADGLRHVDPRVALG